jgi:hypothetical protein
MQLKIWNPSNSSPHLLIDKLAIFYKFNQRTGSGVRPTERILNYQVYIGGHDNSPLKLWDIHVKLSGQKVYKK